MGWVFPVLFGAIAILAFWRSKRTSRAATEIVAAAVLLAIAGYAWQGSPDTVGHPVGKGVAAPSR